MKKLFVLIFFCIIVAVIVPVSSHAEAITDQETGIQFLNQLDDIKTVGYTGPGGDVVIPWTYNGRFVIAVGQCTFAGSDVLQSVEIPRETRWIGSNAFSYCEYLESVRFNNNLDYIQNDAFFGCISLKNVILPPYIAEISDNTFARCYSLCRVTARGGITKIKDHAFGDCRSLESIVLPDSIEIIEDNAFSGCTSLKTVYYMGSEEDWQKVIIEGTNEEIRGAQVVFDYELPKFGDIKYTSYYADPVLWAVENGVTKGTTEKTFSPSDICTRGQIVTFLWRAAGAPKPKSTSCPFKDVTKDKYYYDAVLWAVENGITAGTGKTTFSPSEPCTRGQIATFQWRAAGLPASKSTSCPFTDVKKTSFYYDAVLWEVENGITAGTSKTTFSPSKPCTRGQVVTFLYRDHFKEGGGMLDQNAWVKGNEDSAIDNLLNRGNDDAVAADLTASLYDFDGSPTYYSFWNNYTISGDNSSDSVRWAVEKGYVILSHKEDVGGVRLSFMKNKDATTESFDDLSFEADRKLTRGDAVITLFLHAKDKKFDFNYTKRADITGVTDYADITDEKWLESDPLNKTCFYDAAESKNDTMTLADYLSWAVGVKLISPDADGKLDPYAVITCEELNGMMERYAELKTPYDVNSTLKLTYEASNGYEMPYRLYVPEDYDENLSYPVLLYLHGAGCCGHDNEIQLEDCANIFASPNSPVFESIVIIPQCTGSWSQETISTATLELLQNINQTYSTDRSRQYITGISLGGAGTWSIIANYPYLFSAAIPVAGSPPFQILEEMYQIPIRNVFDTTDELYGDRTNYCNWLAEYMRVHGAVDFDNIVRTGYSHGGICHQYANKCDISLMEWMFAHLRETGINP